MELNKIAAAILLSTLIACLIGFVSNVIYKPNLMPAVRGYSVAVTEDVATNEPAEAAVDLAELMKKANAEAGKESAKKCISCHTFEKDGGNKIGPNLWAVVGKEKAKIADYKYSAPMSSVGGVWDDESLFHLIHKPSKFVPGTKMSFPGISKPDEIANIIAYLRTLHD